MALGKIKADTLEHSTAGSLDTQYVVNGSAKAWVNFDGTASSITARDSFNVSSATDVSTGHYLVSLTNSMSNSNYSGTSASQHSAARHVHIFDRATGNYDVHQFLSTNQTFADGTGTNSVIHGDLA